MRIVSGEKKGIKLKGPYSKKVRPAMDKVKDSIFSLLFPLEMDNLEVLDVFAGTGSVGFEALSRGGKSCTFIESSRLMAKNIKDNAILLGYEKKVNIINKDFRIALKVLKNNNKEFDIIFSDPPYNLGLVDEFLRALDKFNILRKDGILVMEIDRNELQKENYGLSILKNRKYGRTNIVIFKNLE
jgi:16S rRNA (guanine966-N2)-methyltransferase